MHGTAGAPGWRSKAMSDSPPRFGVDLSPWPTILRVEAACLALPAFAAAAPDAQPDAG